MCKAAMNNTPRDVGSLLENPSKFLNPFVCDSKSVHRQKIEYLRMCRYVDDLASVWCEYAEMELRHKNFKNALELLRRATYVPDTYDRRQAGPPNATVFS